LRRAARGGRLNAAMTTSHTITCPRCGERLPEGLTRCDACGAYLVSVPATGATRGEHGGARGAAKGFRPAPSGSPLTGTAWALLVVGLVLGGAIGYSLHEAISPKMQGGAPTGPADIMAGAGAGAGAGAIGGSGMGGGPMSGQAPGQAPQMPAEIAMQVQKFRQVLARDPSNLEANIGLGNLDFDSGQWAHAVEHYTKALEKDPKNGDVRVDMAIAHHNLGQNDVAISELKRVTQDLPEHRNAWLNLGVIAATVGDNSTAIKAWERYLVLEPNGPHAASIRDEISRLKQGS